jgi:hypothetical protein
VRSTGIGEIMSTPTPTGKRDLGFVSHGVVHGRAAVSPAMCAMIHAAMPMSFW